MSEIMIPYPSKDANCNNRVRNIWARTAYRLFPNIYWREVQTIPIKKKHIQQFIDEVATFNKKHLGEKYDSKDGKEFEGIGKKTITEACEFFDLISPYESEKEREIQSSLQREVIKLQECVATLQSLVVDLSHKLSTVVD